MMKITMIKTVSSRESSREGAFTIHLDQSAGNTCCAHQEMEITNFILKSKLQNYFCYFASDEGRKDIRQNGVFEKKIFRKPFSDLLVGNLNPHVFRSNYTCYIFVHAQVKLG